MVPTREIFWNISYGDWIYPFAALAVGWMCYGIYRRIRLWRLGTPEARYDRLGERFSGLLREIFGQQRLLRDRYVGMAHLLIFYGFFVEFLATCLIAIQEWSGIHFLQGTFYLWFSLFADVFGILGLIGIVMVAWRRGVQRPVYLHSSVDDWVALALLFIVFAQGFVIEGARIAVTVLPLPDNWAAWSPGGYVIALMMQGIDPETLKELHRSMWWIHAMTAFAFLAYLSYGKLAHIFYGFTNIFARNLEPSGVLHYPDIEEALENDPDSLDSLGAENLRQFPWKGLLDLDACTNCGRCEQVCPAHGSGVPLSPRKLIQDLHGHLNDVGPSMLDAAAAEGPGGALGAALFGDTEGDGPAPAVLEEELWGCRTCGACQQECPVFIEHVPKIVDMRRYLVMTEAKMSDEAQQFLKNIDDRGHPWVGSPPDREAWFEDLDIKVLGRGDTAEYLFWVGCTGAMVERNIQVTRSVAQILTAAGVDFAVLGSEETCTGDPARRVGGELTYQTCSKTNIETLERYGVKKIIATCPHCFNTLRNEYPDFDGHYEVIHHTQFIAELIREGRLNLKREFDSLTYHDPCYLGRHNGEYDAPREILEGLSRSGRVDELAQNRSKSLCCGAGGGFAWMDDDPEQRINHRRVAQVQDSGAETVAVGCPFCMQMMEDGLAAKSPEGGVRAADVAELVAEALED